MFEEWREANPIVSDMRLFANNYNFVLTTFRIQLGDFLSVGVLATPKSLGRYKKSTYINEMATIPKPTTRIRCRLLWPFCELVPVFFTLLVSWTSLMSLTPSTTYCGSFVPSKSPAVKCNNGAIWDVNHFFCVPGSSKGRGLPIKWYNGCMERPFQRQEIHTSPWHYGPPDTAKISICTLLLYRYPSPIKHSIILTCCVYSSR